jgi:uncharacterized protein (TIGR00299 family) protein
VRIAYFDCFAGASGNMILGSLIDAGLPLGLLERELQKLPVKGWSLKARPVHKHGLGALYLDVAVAGEDGRAPHGSHHHEGIAHRKLADVLGILRAAGFSKHVEDQARGIYVRLGQAEARVHRVPLEEIAFHEVGQVDAIIDIAGAVIALDALGVERVFCSALPCGRGTIASAHGTLPSPAPATLELLRGAPTYAIDIDCELVTPTGAAILTEIAGFAERPPMRLESIGYGSGRSDFPFPNVLRVMIGETGAAPGADGPGDKRAGDAAGDDVVQIETNIDDMSPQLYGAVIEQLFAAGALDVWLTPVHMKKGRPGVVLSALAGPDRAAALEAVILAQTTSIGVRSWPAHRVTLPRERKMIETSLGPVSAKLVQSPAGVRARPEYEDCARIARSRGMAPADVMRRIEREVDAWLEGPKNER